MRRFGLILLTMLLCCNAMARQERDTLGVGTLVSFVENRGQWEQPFRYEAQLHDAAIFLEEGRITVALRESIPHPAPHASALRGHAYRMHFSGSTATTPEGILPQPTHNNYMLGSNPARWQSDVPLYDAVRYTGLYSNIDLEIYGGSQALKYNFIVHTGGDASQVVLEYEGTDGVSVDSKGNLIIRTSVRDIVELKPYVYQVAADGAEVEVSSRWRVEKVSKSQKVEESRSQKVEVSKSQKVEVSKSQKVEESRSQKVEESKSQKVEESRSQKVGEGKSGKVGERWKVWIEVGAYDHSRDLVIDPVLIFSTYTGSTADNWGTTATYDSQKNVYTAGLVFGVGYPVSLGAYQMSSSGNCDIGIFKFDSSGTQRLYATYLGGQNADMPHSLFVNSFDELLVFGTTGSANFPVTAGAFQASFAGGDSILYEGTTEIAFPQGSDIFVSRFSADGSQLQASTFVGGSGNDGLNYKWSYNQGMTYMSGNDSLYYNYGDGARGELITDNLNNIYIGSTTFSADFPVTAGCVQPTRGGRQEGVVFKLDHNMRTMLWSTYLGGSMDDAVYSIDVDSAYNLLACGGTNSQNFPVTEGSLQPTYGGGTADGFVCKLSYNGDRIMASSFLGRSNYDQLYFVRVGRHDEVFLFGQTKNPGTTFIINAAYGIANAGMLLAHLSPDLSAMRWSTLFGTPGRINLSPTAFAADICNRVYAAGWGRDFVPYLSDWYTNGTTGMETSSDAYSSTTDGQDFYIISIAADASQMDYATFFGQPHVSGSSYNGADHVDGGTSRFDRMGTLYQSVCASCGHSQGFPTTPGAWSDSNQSNNCNNALFRFNVTDDFPVADFTIPQSGCVPYTLQLSNNSRGSSYLWDFGDGSTSTEVNPTHTYTATGTYTVTLIAYMPHGCSTADTQRHVVQVLSDTAIAHFPEITCNRSRIQIGLQPALGVTYQWTGDPVSDASVANPWVDTTGTYILHTNATGCMQTDTFHVQNYTLVDQWQPTSVSCHDSVDGRAVFRLGSSFDLDSLTISVTPNRPVSPFYTSGSRTFFSVDSLAPDVTYTVNVAGYGCSYSQRVLLSNPPTPSYTKEVTTALCDDSCHGSIHIWYNESVIPEVPLLDTLIEGLCPGTHVTHLVSMGCPLTDTSVITRDHSLDNFHAWADRYSIYLGESVGLHASDGAAQLQWSPAEDIDHPDQQHPTATPSDTAVCYTVTATTATGCSVSDTVCIHCSDLVCGAPEFVIPNAFTPNGDGLNDQLCFNTEILTEFSIAIFNRWGQCVYQSDDATRCWDGTFHNAPALGGVYTYTCHIRCHNGVENDFKGDITLIR